MPELTRIEAEKVRKQQILVFAIQVYFKQKTNKDELRVLAGPDGHVFQLRYDDLGDIKSTISHGVCQGRYNRSPSHLHHIKAISTNIRESENERRCSIDVMKVLQVY